MEENDKPAPKVGEIWAYGIDDGQEIRPTGICRIDDCSSRFFLTVTTALPAPGGQPHEWALELEIDRNQLCWPLAETVDPFVIANRMDGIEDRYVNTLRIAEHARDAELDLIEALFKRKDPA